MKDDMSDNLTTSIKRYLLAQNDPHVILISGDWGCGKTYFAQNQLREIATELKKKVIYLSLFGIENKEDFERLLLARLLSLNDSTTKFAIFGLKLVKANTNIDAQGIISIWNGIGSNTLIIVDDLERVVEVSAITSILGIINNLVHDKSAKAIIIGNEEEILHSDISDKYSSWKEKSIRYTYKFQININLISSVIVKELLKSHSEILITNRVDELVKKVVEISSCFNLRTYLRSVAQFSQFADLLKSEKIFYDEAIYDLLLTIFALNIEYSTDPKIRNVLANAFPRPNYLNLFSNNSQESETIRNFLAKYFGPKHKGFARIPQIFHAVFDGIWDDESIKSGFIEAYSKDKGNISKLLLTDFRALTDSEFIAASNDVIHQLRKREFNDPVELITIGNLLFYFSENNLIQTSSGELKALLEICLDGLPVTAFLNDLPTDTASIIYGGNSYVHNQDHRAFNEYFKEKWNKYYQEKLEQRKQQLIKEMEINIEPFVNALFSASSDISRQPIFRKTDASHILNKLKIIGGKDILRFSDALMYRYKADSVFAQQFSGEVEFVIAIRDALQSYLFPSDETIALKDVVGVKEKRSLSEFELRDFYERIDELVISKIT